jgi:hypothetical protein
MVASSSSWTIFPSRTWTEVGMKSRVVSFGSSQCHTIAGKIEIVIDRQS